MATSVVPQRNLSADRLLAAVASLRRVTRRGAQRPPELSSLTGTQLELIRLVRRAPGISVAEAAAELSLAPNTVSTLVRQLTDFRILLRLVDPLDRRVARLDLSSDVRRKVDEWRDRKVELVANALGRLSERERCRLDRATDVLKRLAEEIRLAETASELEFNVRAVGQPQCSGLAR